MREAISERVGENGNKIPDTKCRPCSLCHSKRNYGAKFGHRTTEEKNQGTVAGPLSK